MSATATSQVREAAVPAPAAVDMKLEVVVIPVADVDRAKRFYEGLGWKVDADFPVSETFRLVQVTPPGSPCSVHFGTGVTQAAPGSVQNLYLVVDDLDAARADLIAHGVAVSEPFHFAAIGGPPQPGREPGGRSYASFATFRDPDGNGWLLQEIKARFPGRGLANDVATLTELLREAEIRHGDYTATAPKHHWSDWYATYVIARQRGRTPDEAAADGARHVASGHSLPQA